MRFFLACLAIFFFLALNSPAYAGQDFGSPTGGQVNEALGNLVPIRFLPSSPFYVLIYFKENFSRFFQPSAIRRAEFDFLLSGKRLKEAYLLSQEGDFKNAHRALYLYNKRLDSMAIQFTKASAQNQSVNKLAREVGNDIVNHEVLLAAISKMDFKNDPAMTVNLNDAKSKFIYTVFFIDKIEPGIKNRYKEASQSAQIAEPSPTPVASPYETTHSPAKIIY